MSDPGAVVHEVEEHLRPVEVALGYAWWESNTRVSEDADRRREELEIERRRILGDPARLERVRDAMDRADGLERRQLDVVARAMTPNQVDDEARRELSRLETGVESTYVRHRGDIDGRAVSDNDIEKILIAADDVDLRRQAWEASKSVGAAAAPDVLELVRLRNEIARSLGHRDHYAMALALDELDEQRLFATLEDVDRATAAAFAEWKDDLDGRLAHRFACATGDLRPWHYDDPFFQEPPVTGRISLDDRFAHSDIEGLTVRTFEGMGIDLRPVLERSDLYGREGKNQHAFCIHLDREGDVRVLCNVVANERWMATMLHEFGHAAYDRGLSRDVPFLLREPAHMLVTEAVAMLFGRLARRPDWLAEIAGVDGGAGEGGRGGLHDELWRAEQVSMLVFARWVLVMTHFERDLYRDPGGDHDTRWWDLVERFQLVRRPEGRAAPDWAAKIHLAVAPVYYQHYLSGELLASQLEASLRDDAGGIVGRADAGAWLGERIFAPGNSLRWDRLIERATGHELTARHFVAAYAG